MDTIQNILMELIENEYILNPEKAENIDIEEIIKKITNDLVKVLRSSYDDQAQSMLRERRKNFNSFTTRNEKRWKNAFDLLETLIVLCTGIGEEINTKYRPEAAKNDDILFDILVRHHARACHIANEILCLLKNGFADAAHARWRALHEVNATAMFIEKHGNECARRFFFHSIVDSYDGMIEHKKYENRLQEKGPEQAAIDQAKTEYDDVIAEFGVDFGFHYGWAAYIFPNRKARTIGFATIEKDIGLDHMRPYYKWASQNIHAGSKGLKNRLALSECSDDLLVVGQSNAGMTDPAHATALSLMKTTLILLKINPNIDSMVLINIIIKYSDDIGSSFLQTSREPLP